MLKSTQTMVFYLLSLIICVYSIVINGTYQKPAHISSFLFLGSGFRAGEAIQCSKEIGFKFLSNPEVIKYMPTAGSILFLKFQDVYQIFLRFKSF